MMNSGDVNSRTSAPPKRAAWQRRVRSAVSGVLDLFFPPVCVSCHGLVEPDATFTDGLVAANDFPHICESCRRRLVVVRAPHCQTCGYPFFGAVAENIGCPHCVELAPVFREGRTAALLQGPLREVIHQLKYDRALHVLRDIVAVVRANDYFQAFLRGAVLVPVPLHPRKRRERGFNQAELLAECFAQVVSEVRVEPLLRRVVDTPTQTRLDREQRQANLKNAFALASRASIKPGERYVLVDDVFTTGATLNACARVLRRAGVTTLDVATLGHG